MMIFSRTDFPVPDGPITAVIRPRGMSKLTSRSTVGAPNDLVTLRSEMTASMNLLEFSATAAQACQVIDASGT